ncbi:hypothetical protein C8J57DRAFT_1301114 [Mycena rebaudengoi]|nr:hypothetical protein C8J57DRAFT_1301114 [Mycena rebaudengoi]
MPRARDDFFPWYSIIVVILTLSALVVIATLVWILWEIPVWISQGISTQSVLLSRITHDTPISGFYGQGAWWAWLITLGMSHSHMVMALLSTGELPSAWDYDLIAASSYTAVAAVDLINKSRAIAHLGEKASESVLLPALVCAERVVSVGTGAFLLTLLITLLFRCPSAAGTAAIPLILSLIASGFAFHAHQVIWQSAPVLWCNPSLHEGNPLREGVPVTLVDFPASLWVYLAPDYWVMVLGTTGIVAIIVFVASMVHSVVWGRNQGHVLNWIASAGMFSLAAALFKFVYVAVFPICILGGIWVCSWIVIWWPVHILAFFPQIGYSPPSGISVLEMDQFAGFLGVAIVAAVRSLRPVFKSLHSSTDTSTPSEEHVPLLTSSGGSGVAGVGFRTDPEPEPNPNRT